MKAINLNLPKEIYIKDVPMAQRGNEGQVLIKVKSLGICGSDIGAYRGTNPLVSYPRIIGHEIAGEVVEIGENSKGIRVGDRVVIEPYISCDNCYPCSLGRTNCCTDLKVLGVHVDGGMTEYFAHPAELISKIPKDMEWTDAAMVEPLTIALHANHRSGVKAGEHVVISGAGPIGLLAAQVALVYKVEPIIIDPIDERLELARSLNIKYTLNPLKDNVVERIGEITGGKMAEVVIEASGATPAVKAAFDYVSFAGRITLVGWPHEEIELPTALITKKELDVRGSRTSAGEFPEAIDLIYNKKIEVNPIISNIISLEDVPQAVTGMSDYPNKFMKIVALIK